MEKQITSNELEGQLAALDRIVAERNEEAASLALPAVLGTGDAAKRIMAVRAELDRLEGDRAVLTAALSAIRVQEANTQAEAEEAERARHKEAARRHAAALIVASTRVDALIGELSSAICELDGIEREIWSELRSAGEPPSTTIVGRRGLSRLPCEHLQNFLSGRSYVTLPSTEYRATVAWGFLSDAEEA